MEKAVFYARVSTEEEAQVNAIELQIEENISVIKSKGWELVDQYVDRGKSGTQIKKRDEYQRLYEDMTGNKFNIIVIKDQDRLMRNTKDWYLFVERLVSTGKRLYLYLENKFFVPADDALISGIKAIMAEEYSRNLSKKLHNYNDRRLEKAKAGEMVKLQGSGNAFGWKKVNGRYEIEPEQFKVRRLMCELTLQGKGSTETAKILNDMGYRNTVGKPWMTRDIPGMVYDLKNVGTAVLNKERHDFEGKRKIYTDPDEWVYVEGAYPPVVTQEEWERLCAIRERRTTDKNGSRRGKKIVHDYTGKITCGVCKAPYWHKRSGSGYESWICSTKQTKGRYTRKKDTVAGKAGEINPEGCDNENLTEKSIEDILQLIADRLSANTDQIKADMVNWLQKLRKSILGTNSGFTEGDLKREESRKEKLLDSYLDGIISKEDYQRKAESIEAKIKEIKADILASESKLDDIKEIDRILSNIDAEVEKYINENNQLKIDFVKENLEEIVVYPDRVVVKIPIIGREVIVEKIQFAAGRECSRRQTEIISSVGKYKRGKKELDVCLCLVA